MAFRVELTRRARRDLAAIYDYIEASSSTQAFRWFNGLNDAILSLGKPSRTWQGDARKFASASAFVWEQAAHLSHHLFDPQTFADGVCAAHSARSAAGLPRVDRSSLGQRIRLVFLRSACSPGTANSASRPTSGTSRSGFTSASFDAAAALPCLRFTHTVLIPSECAGATSWYKLSATCSRRSRGMAYRRRRASKLLSEGL